MITDFEKLFNLLTSFVPKQNHICTINYMTYCQQKR